MSSLEAIFIVIMLGGFAALLSILLKRSVTGHAGLAAVLFIAFAAFTAIQIGQEGVMGYWINHTVNLSGIQVWWDLVTCALIALFLIAPRARAVGMNLLPWALFVSCLAGVGLLAMCARLFWLERRAAAA